MADSDPEIPLPSRPEPRPFLRTIPWLSVLLIFLPIAIAMEVAHVGEGIPLFVVSALGILGTVTLIGKATEEVAVHAGPVWGGLLNATFGNVTELIIALVALRKATAAVATAVRKAAALMAEATEETRAAAAEQADAILKAALGTATEMHAIVRSSITGSILGNLLLVLGAAMFYGGTKYLTQTFSRTAASVNIGMLTIAVLTLIVPSLMPISAQLEHLDPNLADDLTAHASMTAAVILLCLYVCSLIFSLRTHRFVIMPQDDEDHPSEWSIRTAAIVLFAATCVVAYLSEVFVGAIEHLVETDTLPMSKLFVGVIVVAIVGNAAEGSVAIWVARKDKMELSMQIAMGSGLQVAMMVAPVLVIASWMMSDPANGLPMMTLAFNPFELLALGAGVTIASTALSDGESNWFEGAMFLGVYTFFALVFWFHP